MTVVVVQVCLTRLLPLPPLLLLQLLLLWHARLY